MYCRIDMRMLIFSNACRVLFLWRTVARSPNSEADSTVNKITPCYLQLLLLSCVPASEWLWPVNTYKNMCFVDQYTFVEENTVNKSFCFSSTDFHRQYHEAVADSYHFCSTLFTFTRISLYSGLPGYILLPAGPILLNSSNSENLEGCLFTMWLFP